MFSAERAIEHVRQIAKDPHPIGGGDHDRVRDYIVGQLTALGLSPQIQQTTAIGTRYRAAGRVQNILARLPGSVPNGKAVLLMAHYDGVEAGPAASDDGAGCAAILETLRALRARKMPLAHDVIALFTDGEEAALLGAAAFVREHPWAKDVGVVLNFEARGTSGRSFMFETGAGNLDVARALRSAGDVSAGSVFATIYRLLPNDTDFSETSLLDVPGLNFGFADGVELYHTSRDDVGHLNRGSLQHHGSQMLALAQTFGTEPLPRARTGDGVFFDLPIIGLVVYPRGLEIPLAILALVLVVTLVVRDRRGVVVGVLATLVAIALSGVVGFVVGKLLHGPAQWRGLNATGIVLIVIGVTAACYSVARRWSSPRGLHVGALVVWLIIALFLSVRVPTTGYLFTWPLIFSAVAALLTRGRVIAEWLAAAVTILILVGLFYGIAVVMLGVAGGAIALSVVTSLIALLLAPLLETIAGDARWSGAPWLAGAGIAVLVAAALTGGARYNHPLRSALVYAENADSSEAWFGAFDSADPWLDETIRKNPQRAPAWTTRLLGSRNDFYGRKVERVSMAAPTATLVHDTVGGGVRRIALRVKAPTGTVALMMHARGAKVLASSIDGRAVDTTRYRRRLADWVSQYWAIPDSGALVELSIPAGSQIDFDLAAQRLGIPSSPDVRTPPRHPYVVESQTGDVSIVYRQWRF